MIAALAPDQPGARPLPLRALNCEGDFQRGIDRFGAAVGKEDAVEPVGHQCREPLRQFEGERMPELKCRREIELRRGLRDRLGDLRAAMAGVAAPQARRAVEDLSPVAAPVMHSACRDELARLRLERAIGGKGHPEGRQRIILTLHREPPLALNIVIARSPGLDPGRRGNPERCKAALDCFAPLAMTKNISSAM